MSQPIDIVADELENDEQTGLIAFVGLAMQRLNSWIMVAGSIAILGASLVLTMSVLTRYFFKVPTDWQDEVAVFLIVGAVFMCGAAVQAQRGHVGIEALASILPEKVNRVRRVFVDFASLAYCAFFAWKCWVLLHEAVVDHQTTSSSFGPPLWIPYGLMSVGMSLLSLQIILQILDHFMPRGRAA